MKTKRLAVAVKISLLSLFLGVVAVPQGFAATAGGSRAETVTVSLDALKGFSSNDLAKVRKATAAMQAVLNSEQFRQAVLGFTYNGQRQFVQNELSDAHGDLIQHDMTNEQVYEALMASRETYLNNVDGIAHLDLTLYSPPFWKKWSVVGYGYPGQPQIFMNWNYFNSFTIAEIAGNITHEWTHKLGFDHDYNRTARRPYSVPYAIGQMMVNFVGAGTGSSAAR